MDRDGSVLPIYADQGGGETLKKVGAILAGDLDTGKARILLMLAIAHTKGDIGKIEEYFR